MRNRGTSSNGGTFSPETIDAVWSKGQIVPGHNNNVQRKDKCGAWIKYSNYGDTTPKGSGWQIDHIFPVSMGGSDDLSNLQPLQWQNNEAKSDYLEGQWSPA
jgi:5-methylcytosine-specific restriction endonuclease McrA